MPSPPSARPARTSGAPGQSSWGTSPPPASSLARRTSCGSHQLALTGWTPWSPIYATKGFRRTARRLTGFGARRPPTSFHQLDSSTGAPTLVPTCESSMRRRCSRFCMSCTKAVVAATQRGGPWPSVESPKAIGGPR
ncbi:hypothetical protein Vadar_011134 [Vaccinium darrowii]|uniref:Uncharacterized protein n=1 Tax=Vaccinium darrowii TaxID=229202 RepID=A0ACB7Z338_9ERIC|nr:hypothetical protein Vadar_011134 [Vaccinium darrowii]